jgi:hypothetical protein
VTRGELCAFTKTRMAGRSLKTGRSQTPVAHPAEVPEMTLAIALVPTLNVTAELDGKEYRGAQISINETVMPQTIGAGEDCTVALHAPESSRDGLSFARLVAASSALERCAHHSCDSCSNCVGESRPGIDDARKIRAKFPVARSSCWRNSTFCQRSAVWVL